MPLPGLTLGNDPRAMSRTSLPLKILVTGATGMVGARLVPLLLERGHPVTGRVRRRDRAADSSPPAKQARAWAVSPGGHAEKNAASQQLAMVLMSVSERTWQSLTQLATSLGI